MVAVGDLKSLGLKSRAGSSPVWGTNLYNPPSDEQHPTMRVATVADKWPRSSLSTQNHKVVGTR